MKTIETSLVKGGFQLTQIAREGDFGIYRQSKKGILRDSFEVIEIRVAKESQITIKGVTTTLPDREIYPGDAKWGVQGYTCVSEALAWDKLRWMQNRPKGNALGSKAGYEAKRV